MSYLSFARKYRPQTFDEIIGQGHIATTLKNAIAMDRVAHAYLFTGPRGVGKTSTARILAKSLNCEKGPTEKPCGTCGPCKEISQGTGMDVIEIDGASNRGIDEIRNLRENVKFAPGRGKFRIYIIDEIHMLTQEAFNALLKTLEEPPLHVKFIFATTRPYKVLPTIISRCQRFDFRKIPTEDIVKKLEFIREREKLDVNDEAILLTAKSSDGSMRDAEVILDQLLSFTKGKVKRDDVAKVLGLMEQDILFDLADCVINNEKEKVLSIINDLVNSGKDPIFITTSIITHFRNLMAAKVAEKDGVKSYTALSEENCRRLEEQSRKLSLDEILYVTYTLSAAMDLIRKTSLGRIPLEISLVKLTERKRLASIKEILERLSAIEKRLPAYSREESMLSPEITEPPAEPAPMSKPKPAIAKEEVSVEKDILLFQKIKESWQGILNFIRSKKISVATYLSEGELLKVKDNVLAVGFNKDNSLHKEELEKDTNKKFIEEAIRSVLGEDVFLTVETAETEEPSERAEPQKSEAEGSTPARKGLEPIVESALDKFGGKIINITKENKKEEK